MKFRRVFLYLRKKDSLHPSMAAATIFFLLSLVSLGKSAII
jgi:hypothetical protein